MSDTSDAADLLATARDALLADIVPTLGSEQRYVGLMIANAMAIAAREHALLRAAEADELERLRALAGRAELPASDDASAPELENLRRRLRDAIRGGHFDEPRRRAMLMAHLAITTADRLAISNPKAKASR